MGYDIVDLSTEDESLKNIIGSYDKRWLEESKAKLLKQVDDEKRAKLIMSGMKKQMNKQYEMAYKNYDKLWPSEFYNNNSAKDKT